MLNKIKIIKNIRNSVQLWLRLFQQKIQMHIFQHNFIKYNNFV